MELGTTRAYLRFLGLAVALRGIYGAALLLIVGMHISSSLDDLLQLSYLLSLVFLIGAGFGIRLERKWAWLVALVLTVYLLALDYWWGKTGLDVIGVAFLVALVLVPCVKRVSKGAEMGLTPLK